MSQNLLRPPSGDDRGKATKIFENRHTKKVQSGDNKLLDITQEKSTVVEKDGLQISARNCVLSCHCLASFYDQRLDGEKLINEACKQTKLVPN